MTNNLNLESTTLVKVSELATFLSFICEQTNQPQLWINSGFDSTLSGMVFEFEMSEAWKDALLSHPLKALAVGVSLPIPYADDFQLFYGILPGDFEDKAKLWVLPRAVEIASPNPAFTPAPVHTIHKDVFCGVLVTKKGFTQAELDAHEIKLPALTLSLRKQNPEFLYRRNTMLSSTAELGQCAILPSVMDLLGFMLSQELNAREDAKLKREITEPIAKGVGEDFLSLLTYFLEPMEKLAHVWSQGRDYFNTYPHTPEKPSKNAYNALTTLSNVLTEPVFDLGNALTITDFDALASISGANPCFTEIQNAYITHVDVVSLAPGDRSKGVSKTVAVGSLEAERKWVVLNKQENEIFNPDGPKNHNDNSIVELRNPKTYEPSIACDSHSEAKEAVQTLIQLQGIDGINLTSQNYLCPTVKSWISLLKPAGRAVK